MRLALLVVLGSAVSAGCVRTVVRVVEVRDARCEAADALVVDHAAACEAALVEARAKDVEADDSRVELQATILTWRDARLVCGPLWTPYDQARFETTRDEALAVIGRHERVRCARSLRYVYKAVDAADVSWAEIALADARLACGSRWENRQRIIAVEKLMTDLRRRTR